MSKNMVCSKCYVGMLKIAGQHFMLHSTVEFAFNLSIIWIQMQKRRRYCVFFIATIAERRNSETKQ